MKKIVSLLFVTTIVSSLFLFAETFRIKKGEYDIKGSGGFNIGKTGEFSLNLKCPLDTSTIFNSVEELDNYIAVYKQQLINTRAFETVDVSYNYTLNNETNINDVIVNIKTKDSSHLVILPYPKYDSNDGTTLKLKLKDTNFLGSLYPLDTDFTINYDQNNKWNFNLAFSTYYPFKAGIFNAGVSDSLSLQYKAGNKLPSFSTAVGVSFSYPRELFSVNFGLTQGIYYNINNNETNLWSFRESFNVSTPISLYKAPNYSVLYYSPNAYLQIDWNENVFKGEKIPFKNRLYLSFGHSLSNGRVDWNDLLRKGYNISLSNNFTYNFTTKFVQPSLNLDASFFYNFPLLDKSILSRVGFNSRLFAFTSIDVPGYTGGSWIGNRMRGVLDYRTDLSDRWVPYCIIMNFDFPINLITTNFSHNSLNFTMQFSPFFDIAFSKDTEQKAENLKHINYTTGFEVLVYPKKFSSYTIRASIGFDLKEAMKADNKIKGLWNNKEIYIGLGLYY